MKIEWNKMVYFSFLNYEKYKIIVIIYEWDCKEDLERYFVCGLIGMKFGCDKSKCIWIC